MQKYAEQNTNKERNCYQLLEFHAQGDHQTESVYEKMSVIDVQIQERLERRFF